MQTVTITAPAALVVSGGSSSSVCTGNSAALSATSTGGTGNVSYSWMPGNLSGANQSVSPANTTTYTVTATDANGCLSTATTMVTVNSIPTVTASASPSTIGSGSSSTLTASGAATYSWMPGSLSGTSVTVTPASTTTYTVTGTSSAGCSNTATVTVTISGNSSVTQTKVRLADCGITLSNMSQLIYCDAVTGATDYEWEWVNGNTTFNWVRGNNNTNFNPSWITGLQGSVTYDVRVRAKVGGNWGVFGTVCQITTTVASTKVRTADCGTTLSSMSQLIYCDAVSSAVDYEWEWVNGGTTFTRQRGNNSNNFNPSWITGLQNFTTYNVRVRAKVGGSWGSFGTVCQITTVSSVGTTEVRTADCGVTLSKITQIVYCDVVGGATNYEWEWTTGGVSKTFMRGSNQTSFNPTWIPGMAHATTYDVRVRAYVGSTAGTYGPTCQITTPVTGKMMNPGLAEDGSDISHEVTVIAYPNPTNGKISIDASEKVTGIELYSLSGELILKDGTAVELDLKDLDNGAYLLVVKTETTVKHIRVLKQQ